MKTLSKRSIDYMNLYLTMNNMNYITINKHDFKILYSYYNTGIFEINNLQEEVEYKELWRLEYLKRIDKAIKYIKENACYNDKGCCDDLCYYECDELMNILTGDDSDE